MEFDIKLGPVWKDESILGLDLGSKFLKVVQLQKKGKLTRLVGYGKIEIPENYIIEGIISEPESLAKLIKELFENKVWGEIKAKRVNASLPESKIFTRVLTLPEMNEKALNDAISWEASQSVPMPLTDLYLDWQVIGPSQEDPHNLEILFAAAPKSVVNSYMQLFKELDLVPISLETSLNAITRAMVSHRDKNETLLVIDLGGQTSNIAIFDHVIRVTGSIPVGGDNITEKISTALGIEKKEAEKIKRKTDDATRSVIREAVDLELTEITKEASRLINYYVEKNNVKNPVKKVLLCGGNAAIPHLTEFIAEKLGIPTQIGNPWTNISVYPIKPVPKNEAPAYTNAVGLALLGIENE